MTEHVMKRQWDTGKGNRNDEGRGVLDEYNKWMGSRQWIV
jgi:hypothetical protein